MSKSHIGLEQARATLPALVDGARAGRSSIITRHGKPVAAVVPLQALAGTSRSSRRGSSFLALQGSGAALWSEDAARVVRQLRDEWR